MKKANLLIGILCTSIAVVQLPMTVLAEPEEIIELSDTEPDNDGNDNIYSFTVSGSGYQYDYSFDHSSKTLTVDGYGDYGYDWNNFYNGDGREWIAKNIDSIEKIVFKSTDMTNASNLFKSYPKVKEIDLSGFDTSKVTDMSFMFSNCRALETVNVSGFNTAGVTTMRSMFQLCTSVTSLDVSGFDTSRVSDMSFMFDECNALASLDVSKFNTSSVMTMEHMFSGCRALTSLDVHGFDTSDVSNMTAMFYRCESLKAVDVSGFDTSNVLDFTSMFAECTSLEQVDVTSFKTGNSNMSSMFRKCSSLKSIDVSKMDLSNVGYADSMFESCTSLKSLDLSSWDVSNTSISAIVQWSTGLESFKTPNNMNNPIYVYVTMYDDSGNEYVAGQTPIQTQKSITLHTKNSSGEETTDTVTPETDFEWDGTIIKKYIGSTGSNVNIVIPKKATKIANGAFRNMTIGTLKFEEKSVCSEIDVHAFSNCNLTKVEFPGSLTTIKYNAFEKNSLTSITIPSKVQHLGEKAFVGNPQLDTVVINAKALSDGGNWGTDSGPFYGDKISSITLGNDVTYISECLFAHADLSECDLIIPGRITTIKNSAFENSKLKSITIEGNKLVSIGDSAFSGCGFVTVGLPDSLQVIGDHAFEGSALTSITLPKGLTKIGTWAFDNCKSLKELYYNVPSLSKMGDSGIQLFANVTLEKVVIGSNVKRLPKGFLYKVDLANAKIEVPEGVTSIGEMAFKKSNLSSITFKGKNLKTIESYAFSECPLTAISLPHSVTTVGQGAFEYTKSLPSIVMPQNLTTLCDNTFKDDTGLERVAVYKKTKIDGNPFSGCSTSILTIYGYSGSPAESFAQKNDYEFKSINEWEGGNPYDKSDEGGYTGPVIIPNAGETGLDDAVKIVPTGKDTFSAEMVKGQKYTFGKGSWTSSDTSVISISKTSGAANAKKAGTATLTDSKTGSVINVSVYAPVLSVTKLSLVVGEQDTEVTLSGLSDSTMNTTWASDKCEVASVKGSGSTATITPVGKGKAKISAYAGGKTYSINVTVNDTYTLGKLADDDSIVLNAFQSVNLNFVSKFAANKAIWTDENDNPLSSDSIVMIKNGKITANKVGKIQVKGTHGSNKVSLNVEVKAIPTKSIIYINKDSSVTYKNTLVKGRGMQWTGSDNISLINATKPSVKITADSVGTGELTCTYNGVRYDTTVIVEDPTPSSTILTIPVGSTASITLPGVVQPVVFSSNKKAVAFADEKGNVYARSKGKAVLSAKINGKNVKITVNVTE